jgi:signal transduction histidine kinase/ketosteroid isomerase-like protein
MAAAMIVPSVRPPARRSLPAVSKLRAIVDRTYEAFNAREFDAYSGLLAEDVEMVMSGIAVRGLSAVTDFVTASVSARPGLRIEPVRVVVEADDTLVNEVRMTDTTGAANGAEPLEYLACGLYRIANGRITEWRVYVDAPAVQQASAAFTVLAAEQSALRRVAELVARQAPPQEAFEVVTSELSRLLGVSRVRTLRLESDGSATVVAAQGRPGDRMPPGTNLPIAPGGMLDQLVRTGRPARFEDYAQITGTTSAILREEGMRCAVGGPIVVGGRLWGAMVAAGPTADALPAGSEDRVARFAELVSVAIANVESRTQVERLAAEQSALRRVAELVAEHAPADAIFALVTDELSRLLGVDLMVRTVRFEADGTATILAAHGVPDDLVALGTAAPVPAEGILNPLHAEGIRSTAAGPIIVDGRTWGAMAVASQTALPPGSDERVARFAELVSTAISNIESRAAVERLAAEQSGLRRVATLVARQAPAQEIFALVTDELSHLLGVDLMTRTVRFEQDGTATILAAQGMPKDVLPAGENVPRPERGILDQVFRTGRQARVDDYAQVGGPVAVALQQESIRSAAAGPIIVDGRTWGAMAVASETALPAGSEDRIAEFAELVSTAISNIESRAALQRLAAEQSGLRRVAELVARQAPAEELFALITQELSRVLGVDLVRTVRFEPDGSTTVLASLGKEVDLMPPGATVTWPKGSVTDQIFRTGRPARVDNYAPIQGPVAEILRGEGVRCAAGGPIIVHGRLWGTMVAASDSPEKLTPGSEQRVARFAELASTAISNTESRAAVERLAAEQSALRRVATLVAREYSPEELFATLAEELGVLLGVDASAILRYESGSSATVVAGWSDGTVSLPLGQRLSLAGENLAGRVQRSGAPSRKEDYAGAPGPIAAVVRELGIKSAVASPIIVEAAPWGVIAVLSRQPESLPADTEARLAEFGRVAGMAVANAKSRSELAESRARIVRAGDDARRRFERDLHDGAQQRLVSLGFGLQAAEAIVPAELDDLRRDLSDLRAGLGEVLDDLRELSRGLHPAVLSEGGLNPAVRSLARRSAVPVDLSLELEVERFEEPVEAAAYYVVSEALTNTAKHAQASRVEIAVRHASEWLELVVRDDGRGGADASSGYGLTGLIDRVEAIGGTITIDSPPSGGTAVHVKLPTS